jgi:glycine/D-amino acid oxidase-like deaminating enzyme
MKTLTGSSFYQLGLHTPGTIVMQPAKLVLGLAASLPKNVTLYEQSAVQSINFNSPHEMELAEAHITTQKIVLANNGFAGQFGFYQNNLIPLITWGSLTRPVNQEEQEMLGGTETWNIIPADPFGTSARRISGNRILIRNIYSYSSKLNAKESDRLWAKARHEKSLRNRFPKLKDLTFDYTWGGPLSLSKNGEPVFGDLAPNVYGAFCLNGVGIARGTSLGKLLAEHMAGKMSPLLDIINGAGRPNKLPPRPFLDWGVKLNFANRRRTAGLEL